MPTARIPHVEIQFGGQTRYLIMGHHALGELEEQASVMIGASRIKIIILTLWAALLTETLDRKGRDTDRTLSRFEVARVLDGMTDQEIEAIADKLIEARRLAEPPKSENPTVASPPSE